jgi:hypothetical protein
VGEQPYNTLAKSFVPTSKSGFLELDEGRGSQTEYEKEVGCRFIRSKEKKSKTTEQSKHKVNKKPKRKIIVKKRRGEVSQV